MLLALAQPLSRGCTLQKGSYRYRLTAWNAYGWSEDALSPVCMVNASSGTDDTWPGGAEEQLHSEPKTAERGAELCLTPEGIARSKARSSSRLL